VNVYALGRMKAQLATCERKNKGKFGSREPSSKKTRRRRIGLFRRRGLQREEKKKGRKGTPSKSERGECFTVVGEGEGGRIKQAAR